MTDEGIEKSASGIFNNVECIFFLTVIDRSWSTICPGSDVLHWEVERLHFNIHCKLCSLYSVGMYYKNKYI